MRINVGCGTTPTPGWQNFDNSPCVRLARVPWTGGPLATLGLIAPAQRDFIALAARHRIRWADATRRLPVPDASVEVLYSSHMIGCLERAGTLAFLREAHRVLRAGGILRLAEPDAALAGAAHARAAARDPARAAGFAHWLRSRVAEPRQYVAAFDRQTLPALLETVGFVAPEVLPPGETTITGPGGLDLCERAAESFYVEATARR